MRRFSLLIVLAACNEPPSPALVRIDPAAPDTTHDLVAVLEAPALDLNGDDVTYRYEWLVDGTLTDLTGDTVTAARTARGEIWRVSVFASDRKAEGPAAIAEIVVGNAPPSATVALDPERPVSGVPIRCAPTPSDADEEVVTFTYRWFVNTTVVSIQEVLDPEHFEEGDEVRCGAKPYDGELAGEEASSPTAQIGNAPPVMTSVTISPTSPTRESTLVSTVSATDADGDPISYAYAWKVDGEVVGTDSALPGAAVRRGDSVTVEVIPSDAQGPGAAMGSAPVVILDSLTRITAVSLSPSTVYTDDTITATPTGIVDADDETPTLSYVWTVKGATVQSGPLATLSGSLFSRDQLVAVSVTGDAGFGPGPAATASVTVSNSAPTITGASLDEVVLYESSDVRCTGDGYADADGDVASNQYAWYVDGASVSSARDATGAVFSRGQEVYCVVTARDGTDSGNSITTAAIDVINSPPNPPYVTLQPGEYASATDDLTCELTILGGDDDGDAVTYSYTWTRDGAPLATTESVLPAATLLVGSEYACEVTPYDGAEYGFSSSGGPTTVYPIGGERSLGEAAVKITGDGGSDYFGAGLAGGDWNGDGKDDLLVSHAGSADEVWVFFGPLSSGTASTADLRITPAATLTGWGFGRSAAPAGDFDGDGVGDLIVGMPYDNSITSQNGGAWVFLGGSTGALTTDAAVTRIRSAGNGAQAGFAVAGPGDMDGDGYDDLLVSAPWEDDVATGRNDAGAIYFVFGADTPIADVQPVTAEAVLYGANSSDNCGYSFASPGDVDGDGYANVVVGCVQADGTATRSGAAYLLDGPATWTTGSIASVAVATFAGTTTGDYTAQRVSAPGDVNGDGRGDFFVQVPNADNGATADVGAAYLLLAPVSGTIPLTTASDAVFYGTGSSDVFGSGMAGLSDLDGDGIAEIAMGAYGDDDGSLTNIGSVALFYGALSGAFYPSDARACFSGEKTGDQAGWAAASPGDYDGDGTRDLLVSAPTYDVSSLSDAGAIYLIPTGP